MKYWLYVALACLFTNILQAQNPAIVDSFKLKLARAKTPEEKVEHLANLSMVMMNTNMDEADKYGQLVIQEAELSRKRPLMVKALLYNAQRYGILSANRTFLQKSIAYYSQALDLAKQNNLEKEKVESLLGLAISHSKVPDLDKSINYTTQAFAIASALKDDTLKIDSYNTFGDIYQHKKERLLALRNYLSALRIAEEVKNHNYLRSCYSNLSNFYADIKAYDKAIDYAQMATDELLLSSQENIAYMRVVDLYGLGNLYVAKKNFEMSVYYFEKSIRLADSLHYEPLKMPGYNGLLNQYLEANQPEKALAFFNNRTDLKKYIHNFGFDYNIDHAYGYIYMKLGKYDSAKYYFDKAQPGFETASSPFHKIVFYSRYGELYDKAGDVPQAIANYTKAKTIADAIGNLDWQKETAAQLDSMYAKAGDYKQSRLYANLYHTYKDSLQKLGEQKDLLQAELADEQQREERIRKETAAALERKHALQYTGISIAIAIIFVLLVAMGIFRVSETTIKIMGFFSFILLFEFITLIADTKIHHWTHGEPLPILGIKIVLIAAMLPFHHWLEHKVVTYLASRRLIIPSGRNLWQTLVVKKKLHSGHPVKQEHGTKQAN
jgi:tetratricopeptide (TPR) repeat protein